MKIAQECLIQSVSYLRKKVSYEEACKHSDSVMFKYNKIITTKKYYRFVRCKPRIAKKRFENYEKITSHHNNGAICIEAYYNTDIREVEGEEKDAEEDATKMGRAQSVLIPREKYSLDEAFEYMKENYYRRFLKLYISTPKYYRFTFNKPKYLTHKLNLNNVIVKTNNETGIKEISFH